MRKLALVLMFVCGFWVSGESAGADEDQPSKPLRVLVLFSNQRTLPANQEMQRGIWSSLEPLINSHRIELFEEYLEFHRLPVADENPPMVSFLKKRYKEMVPDVIVLIGTQALDFSEKWMSSIFPDAKKVFAGVLEDQARLFGERYPSAGVVYELAVQPLLEKVEAMMPEVHSVVLVAGAAKFDREVVEIVKDQLEDKGSWEISEIVGEMPESAADKLSDLPSGTVVVFTSYFQNTEGVTYIPRKVLKQLSEKSSAPIFALYDTMLGSGATGIGASPFIDQGREAGELIQRIVAGESPREIGTIVDDDLKFRFDAREMRRYGLDPKLAPEGVEIFYEYPGLIESHPYAFFFGTMTILVQSLLICSLLWTRYQKQKAENQAHEMERYFATVFEQNPNPMAVIRVSDGTLQDINPAWEKLYELTREAVLGRTPLDVGILSRDTDAGLYQDFVKNGKVLSGYEREVRTGSGEMRNVAFYSNTVEVGGNRVRILTTVDASDRIEAEKLRNSLSRGNRVAQLGQVSAWIAHEINQPLGSILSNAESGLLLLEQKAEQARDTELQEILSDIKKEDRRATKVVEHIRTMLGNHSTAKSPLVVSEIFDDVFRMASPEAKRRVVDLRYPSGGIPKVSVLGDRVLLVQVLLNLVFNAMDAVGGVPMSKRIVSLACEASLEDGWVDLIVCDRGPGIPPDQLSSVFEFFYSTKEDGMGLGLAISRFIVEDHRGEITVRNMDGSGARFQIRLLLHEPTNEH